MKIKVTTKPAITDGMGVITEDVYANNIFLGRLVFRPESFDFAGWAAFAVTNVTQPVWGPTADRDECLNMLTGRAISVVKAARNAGFEVVEPTDEEFYGEAVTDWLLSR